MKFLLILFAIHEGVKAHQAHATDGKVANTVGDKAAGKRPIVWVK